MAAQNFGVRPAPVALGVCSWSLRPTSPTDLVEKVLACGVNAVQLGLDPIREGAWRADETIGRLKLAGIRVVSGMMGCKGEDYSTLETIRVTGGLRPDATWQDNLRAAEGNAVLAARFGLPLVSFHAGFLPQQPGDPLRAVMIDRLKQVAEIFASRRCRVAFETGQESAATLAEHLEGLHAAGGTNAGVNFDPANMILYGMGDPIEALKRVAKHIAQIHLKDATPTKTAGTWGAETPLGKGAVDWRAFFQTVKQTGIRCDFMIEREAGDERIEDINAAAAMARGLMREHGLHAA